MIPNALLGAKPLVAQVQPWRPPRAQLKATHSGPLVADAQGNGLPQRILRGSHAIMDLGQAASDALAPPKALLAKMELMIKNNLMAKVLNGHAPNDRTGVTLPSLHKPRNKKAC